MFFHRTRKAAVIFCLAALLAALPSFGLCQNCEFTLGLGTVCTPVDPDETGKTECDDRLGQCRLFGDDCPDGGS